MVSVAMAAQLLVSTTLFTNEVLLAEFNTFSGPFTAGSINSFCESFTLVVKGGCRMKYQFTALHGIKIRTVF